ncbi:cytochrome c oxidase subunit 4 [Actinosynnema pretiosum subsp. pretiosum]|uniref:Cytochrome c oxidase polypeptide 4 n=3 Tax=Actinosynnema TaxID=40566 RepID=C6W9F7_ACTMD|nr:MULTISPECIES: cytochrome c oxidase subunit 4 [Actinosynnema]ACU35320.1 Cytochrome-c oxidase [Actinosynnema mirum DSM 43827]ATE53024.1 cytochrome C oxidase subunit IV [Actinosynnema pretiosum]AXX28691.1 putative cytochrome c oxidase polypeptide 4 [Actinosynnema pretiosum subsp. pretiosum]QUF06985.1 cytochrome c oxidase subunit 4 [Actinosynnema pretiosum subsp. pretiosum]
MKVESRVFDLVTGFSFLMTIVYAYWTWADTTHVEPVGTVALALTGGLALLVGTYFRFIARRIEVRPEDNPDAEISDGAGELGFFSPGSYWPVALAAAAAVTGVALAFWLIWLLVIGVVLIVLTVGGLVFEYHTGPAHD